MLDTLDETTTQLDSKESLKRDPSIPSLYRHYVPTLHGNGNGYLGKCPRHADDTPSFSVYKDQDGSGVWCYKCWGCNSAGDIFHFLKWLNDTSFVEAKKEVMTFLGRDQKYDAAKEKINNTLSAPKPVEKPSRMTIKI
jgi:DNA primase